MKKNIATYMTVAFFAIFVARFFAPINEVVIAVTALLLTITAMLGIAENKWTRFFFHETELAGITVGLLFLIFFLIHNNKIAEHCVHEIAAGGWKSAIAVFTIMGFANLLSKDMLMALIWVDSKLPNNRSGNFLGLLLFQVFSSLVAQPGTAKLLAEFYFPRVKPEKKNSFGVGLATGIGTGGGVLPFTAPAVAIVWGSMQLMGWDLAKYFLMIVPALLAHVMWVSWMLSGMLHSKDNQQEVDLTLSQIGKIVFLLSAAILQIFPLSVWFNVGCTILVVLIAAHKPEDKGELPDWKHVMRSIKGPAMIGILMIAFVPIGAICKPIFVQLLNVISSLPAALMIITVYFVIKGSSAISDNALLALIGCGLPAATNSPVFVTAVILGALAGGILLEGSNIPNIPIRQTFNIEKTEWPKKALKWYVPSLILFPMWIYLLSKLLPH